MVRLFIIYFAPPVSLSLLFLLAFLPPPDTKGSQEETEIVGLDVFVVPSERAQSGCENERQTCKNGVASTSLSLSQKKKIIIVKSFSLLPEGAGRLVEAESIGAAGLVRGPAREVGAGALTVGSGERCWQGRDGGGPGGVVGVGSGFVVFG